MKQNENNDKKYKISPLFSALGRPFGVALVDKNKDLYTKYLSQQEIDRRRRQAFLMFVGLATSGLAFGLPILAAIYFRAKLAMNNKDIEQNRLLPAKDIAPKGLAHSRHNKPSN